MDTKEVGDGSKSTEYGSEAAQVYTINKWSTFAMDLDTNIVEMVETNDDKFSTVTTKITNKKDVNE